MIISQSDLRLQRKCIAILTGASLAWNPRALKEAGTLARAGFDVIVLGSSANSKSLKIDYALAAQGGFSFQQVASSPDGGFVNLRSAWRRVRHRFGKDLFRICGIANRWQLGPIIPELLFHARKMRADYWIVHLEQGIWVGTRLLRIGRRVGVDMEDWYSEDLSPDARKRRPVRMLRALERQLLTQGAYSTCPSRAMSVALAQEYGSTAPTVVYNAFSWSDRSSIDGLLKDRKDRGVCSIHWFSQTLGPGRGLESLFGALSLLNYDVEIHLRGNPVDGFQSWLAASVPECWRDRIYVHEMVSNGELLSRIAEHDIGFAGEMTYSRSRELTITNKILYYLLAGIAVVASDTPGQREVANQAPGAVFLHPPGDAVALAASLNALLGSSESLRIAKVKALHAAEQTFCWERQEKVLLDTVVGALSMSAR